MAEQKNIMSYETVALDDEQSALVILDQTKLPYEVEVLHLTEQKDIWDAIYLLKVRGAPAIGVAGGFGGFRRTTMTSSTPSSRRRRNISIPPARRR